jgi:antitoxin FitA
MLIQLRNVPDALHSSLMARAALVGLSLSDYVLAEIKEVADRPTLLEFEKATALYTPPFDCP